MSRKGFRRENHACDCHPRRHESDDAILQLSPHAFKSCAVCSRLECVPGACQSLALSAGLLSADSSVPTAQLVADTGPAPDTSQRLRHAMELFERASQQVRFLQRHSVSRNPWDRCPGVLSAGCKQLLVKRGRFPQGSPVPECGHG